MTHWHQLDISAILSEMQSDAVSGLSRIEASDRLNRYGPNELLDRGGKSPLLILWEQFTSTMALILTGAALISGYFGSPKDCITIMAIVCLFAFLGFYQEYQAERTIRALKRLAVPFIVVRRDGVRQEVLTAELVPGDIVLLEPGTLVPADCRILESYNLKIQESVLTGESEPVAKKSEALHSSSESVADRNNMTFMGTTVTYGRGVAIVIATGMATELGKIAAMLQDVPENATPLQKRLDRLGKILATVAVVISAIYFVLGMLRGEELRLLLMTAVSLAVAVIPEGLPAVVTITMAIGSQRMLRRRVLIRKLPAVETLGSVTVICSDKTGTLTENKMTVTEIIPAAHYVQYQLLASVTLCNDADARIEEAGIVTVGDPTEWALLVAAITAGITKAELEELYPRIAEIPFDASTRRMITIHEVTPAGAAHQFALSCRLLECDRFAVAKGAVDVLLPLCPQTMEPSAIMAEVEKLASQGRRVLACTIRRLGKDNDFELPGPDGQMEFVGLIAMMDPPRLEARAAVLTCIQAGIRPVMITGDHPRTAISIAESLGISCKEAVMTGAELDRIGPIGLTQAAGRVSVYARVSPEHKLLIVEALQQSGEVVAMTGDGVNDAPALKKADIGVSMGMSGTDAAKEAADMVLLDDNFATIVSAVEEGRTIYDNIRKFIEFSVAGNLGKVLTVLLLPFLGIPSPLTPLQLLWLNLLTDGLLGLGMGVEKAEPDIMRRPPISPAAQIFDRRMVRHTLLTGTVIAITTIMITLHQRHSYPGTWQTVLFSSLAFAQIGQAMALRSFGHSFFQVRFFSNPLLLGMVCLVVILQALVVYLPVLQQFFSTTTIGYATLAWVFVPGIILFTVLEIEKRIAVRQLGRPSSSTHP